MGKSEKRYVTKLKANIESYCEDEEITTKEELYEKYGLPNNVVNDYFSAADTEYIVKKIKTSKYIKAFISVILTSVFCAFWYQNHQMLLREEALFSNEVIEE